MRVDAIKNGIVIDHIEAGRAMQIFKMLSLDKLECPVAILKNVPSVKMGKKDIIKIDGEIDLDLDMLGFISPTITVVVVKGGEVVEKRHIDPPLEIEGIVQCKNPRCITSTEQGIRHKFRLTDGKKGTYRCIYCDAKAELK